LLIIHGSMCSGKTTIINLFCELNPGFFFVSFDKTKRLISDYAPGKYSDIINDLVFCLSNEAAKSGLSLIIEGNYKFRKILRETYKNLADKYNMSFVEINIEAPLEILKSRFVNRIAESDSNGNKFFVRNIEGMLERYEAYMANINKDLPVFDSNLDSPEKICAGIKSIMNQWPASVR
jgi:predicted kinase